ncbi:hypothetical protein LIER_27722 [Lithospermum erythrorhizon]|uniref:Uncharacterized protein n=1 Tax=Lithospermum erythrorhizon TaxID=34254 RepID=A0AAV3RG22_LITER
MQTHAKPHVTLPGVVTVPATQTTLSHNLPAINSSKSNTIFSPNTHLTPLDIFVAQQTKLFAPHETQPNNPSSTPESTSDFISNLPQNHTHTLLIANSTNIMPEKPQVSTTVSDNLATRGPLSYAQAATVGTPSTIPPVGFDCSYVNNLRPVAMREGKPIVVFKRSDKQRYLSMMKYVLVGKFLTDVLLLHS